MKTIIHICEGLTINVYKKVFASTRIDGLKTRVFYQTDCNPTLSPLIPFAYKFTDRRYLIQRLKSLSTIDDEIVLHVHTTLYNPELIELVDIYNDEKIQIVWDIADLSSNHKSYITYADKIIVPSKGYQQSIPEATVICRKVPEEWIKSIDINKPKSKGIVLQSGIDTEITFRDYRWAQDKLNFNIYPSDNLRHPEFRNVMKQLPYMKLLNELSYYKYGYSGAPNKKVDFHGIVTNKFWEYLAVGCMPIMFQSDEMKQLCEDIVGYSISIDDMDDYLKIEHNPEIYLESEYEKLVEIYYE